MSIKLKKKIVKWIWGVTLFPFVFLFLMIVLINWGVFGKMPTFEDLENPQSELATEVYAEDGSGNYTLLGRYALKNRSHIEYKELSPHLVKALIATEDVRFVKHSGIDYRSLVRVLFKTVLRRDNKYGGGSTITQQLALNLYSERSSNKIKRVIQKLQEWVTAVNLEKNYTKSEIITMYFNTIPFGFESYGIRTAAQTYFNKLPAELNLEEAALMVGILNAPSWYNPVKHPQRAKDRRNIVLGQMVKYGYLAKKEYDSISKLDINMKNFKLVNHNTGYGTYFRETLRQIMKMQKPDIKNYRFKTREEYVSDSLQWEKNPLFGWCNKNLVNGRPYNIDRDGLKIYTTIDAKMQQYAEDAVVEHLSKTIQPQFNDSKRYRRNFPFSNLIKDADVKESFAMAIKNSDRYRSMKKAGYSESEIMKSFDDTVSMTVFSWRGKNNEVDTVMTPRDSIRYYKSILRVAFMAIEPNTGRIKAYVGGHNFKYFKFDNAWQGRRQIGSTIKPFLYTLAFQEGWTPCSKVFNNRQTIPLPEGGVWSPETSEKEEYLGKNITLKLALALSSNNVSAYLIQRISPHALMELCRGFGLTGYMEPVPSICLGSSDMSLFEMVAAYNVFPSKGMYTYPFFVSHIDDKYGNRLATFVPDKKEVISEETAYTTVNLMQGVTLGGTGNRVRNYVSHSVDVAGKTGTTNKNSDGWFIGYVPKLTVGVWVGNEDRGAYLLGDGARMSLPIWGLFMKKVLANTKIPIRDTDKFEVPPGIDKSIFNCSNDDNEGNTE